MRKPPLINDSTVLDKGIGVIIVMILLFWNAFFYRSGYLVRCTLPFPEAADRVIYLFCFVVELRRLIKRFTILTDFASTLRLALVSIAAYGTVHACLQKNEQFLHGVADRFRSDIDLNHLQEWAVPLIPKMTTQVGDLVHFPDGSIHRLGKEDLLFGNANTLQFPSDYLPADVKRLGCSPYVTVLIDEQCVQLRYSNLWYLRIGPNTFRYCHSNSVWPCVEVKPGMYVSW